MSERARFWWQSSAVLMAASAVGAAGNYLFQAIMGRLLPLSEFGYLNAALGLSGLVAVGVAAAGQAVAHYLARHQARDEQQRVAELKTASSVFLLWLTVVCSALAMVLIHPVSVFFRVPRPGIVFWVLAAVLVSLWSGLANAWCAGLKQFYFMAFLGVTSVAIRICVGAVGGWFWGVAEAGLAASVFCGLTVVFAVLWRDRALLGLGSGLKPLWEREFLGFLLAAFAVSVGNHVFLLSDAVVAQRWLSGPQLGAYTAAGLFGRAVVSLPLPVLTVFFTARSGRQRSDRTTMLQLAAYGWLVVAGAVAVMCCRGILCELLLGRREDMVLALMGRFAVAMIPVGALHALAFYVLAARRFGAAVLYGVCGLVYGAALTWFGRDVRMLLWIIGVGAVLTAGVVGGWVLSWRGRAANS